jgi:L-iditol 2-dehydrogenase
MKAAVLHAPGDLRVEEVDTPERPFGGLLLRTRICALCSTDLHMIDHGERDLVLPRIIGHEFVGEVVDSDADGFKPGMVVQLYPGIACGTCRSCLKGMHNHCENGLVYGFDHHGGMAEYVSVPSASISIGGVNPIPDGMRYDVAVLAEPLSCCINAQGPKPVGEAVIIVGGGPMGCIHAILARLNGAKIVMIIESFPSRAEMAWRTGADSVLPPEDPEREVGRLTGGRGADLIVLTTNGVEVNDVLPLLAHRGRVCLFSNPRERGERLCLSKDLMFYRENAVFGSFGSTSAQCREAMGMLESEGDRFGWIISCKAHIDKLEAAMEHMRERKGLKAAVDRF